MSKQYVVFRGARFSKQNVTLTLTSTGDLEEFLFTPSPKGSNGSPFTGKKTRVNMCCYEVNNCKNWENWTHLWIHLRRSRTGQPAEGPARWRRLVKGKTERYRQYVAGETLTEIFVGKAEPKGSSEEENGSADASFSLLNGSVTEAENWLTTKCQYCLSTCSRLCPLFSPISNFHLSLTPFHLVYPFFN